MKTAHRFIPVSALAAGLLIALAAHAGLRSQGDAVAGFDAVGPGGLKIRGTTPELSVSEGDGKVTVKVPLAKLTTGISLRDRHMREKYLEVGKYPDAVAVVPRSGLEFPAKGATVKSKVNGTMAIHGVSQPVKLKYTATNNNGAIAVDGSCKLDMREFGINVPTYLGVGVDPKVDVDVKFEVVDK